MSQIFCSIFLVSKALITLYLLIFLCIFFLFMKRVRETKSDSESKFSSKPRNRTEQLFSIFLGSVMDH